MSSKTEKRPGGVDHLSRILEATAILNTTPDLSALLKKLIEIASEVVNAEASSLFLLDELSGEVICKVASGGKSQQAEELIRLTVGQGIGGWVVQHAQPLIVNDVSQDIRFYKDIDVATGFRTLSILCTPLKCKGRTIGSIEALNSKKTHGFDQEDLKMLQALANQAAIAIENARLHERLALENQGLKAALGKDQEIIGTSPAMRHVGRLVDKVARTESTILIRGESGTGKEVVARAIHALSQRRNGPFICVTCSVFSENLLESELFGHEKGAFTGATERKLGRFELARGGTVLLDEIGTLSPQIQLKLLRFLQEHEFERVGDPTPRKVDVRIIAATNENLEKAIEEGRFREDLYYRLKVIEIEMPPLRNRKDDIPALVAYFLGKVGREVGIGQKKRFHPDAITLLQHYDWPGNVRELKNVIERAIVLSHDEVILPAHLPFQKESLKKRSSKDQQAFSLDNAEKEHIAFVLSETQGNKSEAARLLGISRNRLDRKIHQFGLS